MRDKASSLLTFFGVHQMEHDHMDPIFSHCSLNQNMSSSYHFTHKSAFFRVCAVNAWCSITQSQHLSPAVLDENLCSLTLSTSVFVLFIYLNDDFQPKYMQKRASGNDDSFQVSCSKTECLRINKNNAKNKTNNYMKESLETGWCFDTPRESTAPRCHCVCMLTHPYTPRAGWPPTVSAH